MLIIDNLKMTYGRGAAAVQAIKNLSLTIPDGQILALLGPSGCGKTSVLRCVAGLEHPSSGQITLADKVVYSGDNDIFVPTYKRDIGMFFQSYALWPHKTVAGNIAFPLQLRRRELQRGEIRKRVDEILVMVGLDGYGDKLISNLSGGQQQRVALARALVSNPGLLLLDEPLSNIDAKQRERVRDEIRSLQQAVGATTLFVTHDQQEAIAIADLVAVMRNGVIEQVGKPRELYDNPRTLFVAQFMGTANCIPAIGQDPATGMVLAETSHGSLLARQGEHVTKGDSCILCVRPQHVSIFSTRPQHEENVLEGVLERKTFHGRWWENEVRIKDDILTCVTTSEFDGSAQSSVFVYLPPERCCLLKSDSEKMTSSARVSENA